MTGEKIRSIFDFNNSSVIGPIQIPGLSTILMTTNHALYFREDFLTFDFDEELVKIKKYIPVVSSARINQEDLIISDDRTILRSEVLTIIRLDNVFEEFGFRNPKAGDKLGIYNKSTKETEFINIIQAGARFIQLESPLDNDLINKILFYVDGENFGNTSKDLLIPYLYFRYKPHSSHIYDTVLDMNYILGFETVCSRIGNN